MFKTSIYIYIILSVFFQTQYLFSKEIVFEKITSKDGLSQNDVIGIYKDSRGYMWFCTQDGLNRYDGYEFTVFRASEDHEMSISGNLLSRVVEDENDNLWIATQDNGVNVFNMITHEIISILNTEDNPDVITDNNIIDIICDSKNRIIVSTAKGINILQMSEAGDISIQEINNTSYLSEMSFSNYYGKILETSNGEYVFCSTENIYKIETDSSGDFTGEISKWFSSDSFSGYHNILEIENGFIVGAWFSILYLEYNDLSEPVYKSSIANVNNMVFATDNKNNLWTGGSNGLSYYEYSPNLDFPYTYKQGFKIGDTEFELSNDFIRSIYIDESQALWVGTNGGGINKYDPNKRQFRKYNNSKLSGSINHNKVLSITEDSEGNVWFGTEGGGINLLPKNNAKNYASGFSHIKVNDVNYQNYVYDIIEVQNDDTNRILGASSFLSLVVELTKRGDEWQKHYPELKLNSIVMALLNDSENNIWICTYKGGILKGKYINGKLQCKSYTMQNSSIPTDVVRSIYEDSKKRIWIGTGNGLMLIDSLQRKSDSLEFTLFKNIPSDCNSLSYNYILPIVENSKGEVWIGTYGGGINIYQEGTGLNNGYFKRLSQKDGLVNSVIKDIVEDKNGAMWFSSNKGITRYSYIDSTLRNYGIKDGLQDNEFADRGGCVLSDGEILFGGVNGFNVFYPDEINEDTVPPKVVFSNFELVNKIIEVGEELNGRILLSKSLNATENIILKYTENSFAIHFSALHYTAPESNQFKYMLKGFDKDWVIATSSSRFAKYTNIDPGKYTFLVMAANGDGKWVKDPKSINIEIKVPFWKTGAFKFMLGAIAIILFVIFNYTRIQAVKVKNAVLEKEVKSRTREITNKNEILQEANVLLEEQKEQILSHKEEIEFQKEELENHRNNLEILIKARTKELENALKKAKESDELKTAFLANFSHEIRTPMNAIIGFSSLMNNDDTTKEERAKFIDIVGSNARTLLGLIDEILDLSLIESNQFKLKKEEFYLNGMVDNLHKYYSINNITDKLEIRLNNTLEVLNIKLFSDYTRIKQVITNFMNNACKFTDEGYIELGVKYENNNLVIYVEDTGIGIPESKRKHIFERFVKLESSNIKEMQGLGLGLAISKRISKELGGDINVTSIEGKGSTFSFVAPMGYIEI